jgi:hypothetical protein
MNREITLCDILQIEDISEILQIRCPDTGIPLWSTIRVPFLRLIMGDLLYGVPMSGSERALSIGSRIMQAVMISRSFAYNAFRFKTLNQQYSIMVMATGARLIERDGRYFNTLSDYFVTAVPESTFAVEGMSGSKWPFPRHNNIVLLHTPLRVEGALKGRLRAGGYRYSASALVDLVSQRAKNKIGWDIGEGRRQWLEGYCTNGAASLLPRYLMYQSIFKRMKARLLIKEEACYGGADNATAILAARHLGMVTAEYQHGMASSGHDAYNYAPAVSNNHEYQQILPEYFLTYGSWWGEQINAPVKKITIGNPYRAETIDVSSSTLTRCRQILILGDGIDTNIYIELCDRLAAVLGSAIKVVFRPHPLERARVWAKHPDGFMGEVRIDNQQDIYSSFRESEAVASEVSTGLFDAIGLIPKIFIWDTPKSRFAFPVQPFQGFSDADELARLVLDESAGRVSTQQLESIWAPHWKRNYLDFIEQVVQQ